MKKIITLALAISLFSCAKDTATEYAIITGKFTGVEENNQFTISGNSFKKEVKINTDGTFTDTLNIAYNGSYQIEELGQIVYLEAGKTVTFTVDFQKPLDIVYTGNLAIENNYNVNKLKIQSEILGDDQRALYGLDESVYVNKIDEFTKKSEDLLKATTFETEKFSALEKKNIGFAKTSLLETYKMYHGYITGNEDFVVSDTYPKLDESIDFDNEEDYNFSRAYRDLVSSNFEITSQKETEKGADYYDVSIKNLNAIKSQNIKNSISQNLAYQLSSSGDKMETFYNALHTASTDESFKKELEEKYNKLKVTVKGKPSPKFTYENHKGGTTSLDELKGKYVYIDVWATWCGPCIAEIPALKEVEKKYHGKNIEFVSISIDEKKDHEKWKKFVTDKGLVGTQLYADNAWKSQFVQDYVIEGIPRFILIDPNGNIVSADAPRPSDKELLSLFTELGL